MTNPAWRVLDRAVAIVLLAGRSHRGEARPPTRASCRRDCITQTCLHRVGGWLAARGRHHASSTEQQHTERRNKHDEAEWCQYFQQVTAEEDLDGSGSGREADEHGQPTEPRWPVPRPTTGGEPADRGEQEHIRATGNLCPL